MQKSSLEYLQTELKSTLYKLIYHNQVAFVSGMRGFSTMHHIKRIMDINHIVIRIYTEKAYDQVQQSFVIKNLIKL
jgi:hypothetical protein